MLVIGKDRPNPPPHPPPPLASRDFTCCKKWDLLLVHIITVFFWGCANDEVRFFLHSVNTVKVHLYIALSIFITKQVMKLIPSRAVIPLVNWTARVNLKNSRFSPSTSGLWFLWFYWPLDWFYTCISILRIFPAVHRYTNDRSPLQMYWSPLITGII